jgi:hypothetical protein
MEGQQEWNGIMTQGEEAIRIRRPKKRLCVEASIRQAT